MTDIGMILYLCLKCQERHNDPLRIYRMLPKQALHSRTLLWPKGSVENFVTYVTETKWGGLKIEKCWRVECQDRPEQAWQLSLLKLPEEIFETLMAKATRNFHQLTQTVGSARASKLYDNETNNLSWKPLTYFVITGSSTNASGGSLYL